MVSFTKKALTAAPVILLCLLMAALGPTPAGAAEPGSALPDPAAQRELIRRQMEAVTDRVVRQYLVDLPEGLARPDVLVIIGALYEMGRLGEANPVRAEELYLEAAKLDSVEAACSLGNLYQHGAESLYGVIPKDPERSREWYRYAAERGSVKAMVELGAIYTDGQDIDPDAKLGLKYYLDAAKYANPTALDRLEPVMRKAREWEEARPGRDAGFPTSKEEIIDEAFVQEFIDVNFYLEQVASKVFVELSRRIAAELKG
ncbi:MAG: sel1 repeat family protein [Planctomycetes bacterium]|nr:sel1 repeat family protein [Planctomycetota bacterium]